MTYREENDALLNSFYTEFFYKRWNGENPKCVEFIFSPYCDLGCKYCYVNHTYDKIFPLKSFKSDLSIENALKYCNWLVKNHYTPTLNIFSGEIFAQECGFKLLEKLLEFYSNVPKEDRLKDIVIPTNGTFCSDLNKITRVEKIIAAFQDIGIPVYLSFSLDGKFMDKENRPFKNGLERDRYYDRIFTLARMHNYCFHPMIYSNNIDKWIENFDWFQSKLCEFNIPWSHVYLLQVRNKEWTREQNLKLYEFIRYIIRWSWHKCDTDIKKYFGFLFSKDERGLNILSWLHDKSDGYGCSIQHEISIRLNDMKIFPCHRLMYPEFEIGQYDENFNIKSNNVGLGIAIPSIKVNSSPLCNNCDLSEICQGGCLGAQYETNHSMITPIPTVCLNYIYLYKALVDGFDEIEVLDEMMKRFSDEKNEQINKLRRLDINEI